MGLQKPKKAEEVLGGSRGVSHLVYRAAVAANLVFS